MLERDGKIEQGLVKGSQLRTASTGLKKRAVVIKKVQKKRYYCFWIVICTVIITAIALIVLFATGVL